MFTDDPVDQKLLLDTQLIDVYLTGLQSEIEAKLRAVSKFRAQMRQIDGADRPTDLVSRLKAARALIERARTMLETNRVVRGMLEDLLKAAEAVSIDLEEAAGGSSGSARRQ